MGKDDSAERHKALNLLGFRALATAAGLLQLCRELENAGVLKSDAIARIREAMFEELMKQVARSRRSDNAFATHLRQRLEALFAGTEKLDENPVMPSD